MPRGFLDSVMMALGRKPYRCRRCERRFYAHPIVADVEPEPYNEPRP